MTLTLPSECSVSTQAQDTPNNEQAPDTPSDEQNLSCSPSSEMQCDTKELIQENGGLNEAHKERARSRGMSLLMEARMQVTDEPKTGRLFAFLQILTASFGAFAHGGNDVRYLIFFFNFYLIGRYSWIISHRFSLGPEGAFCYYKKMLG